MNTEVRATPHAMVRLDIPTAMSFDDFRLAFEAAAPVFDAAGVQELIAGGAEWQDVQAAAERNAPNGLMVYAVIDIGRIMAAAGHATRCVQYLLGNHVVAERMFRHDPAIALYAPLRVIVTGDADDQAVFTVDRPSSVFAGLGQTEITGVGTELDHKVARLLQVITGRAPAMLLDDADAPTRA
ncbi:MAG TPA: DUF302 domain-containing protein [Trebonia sp.]